MFQADCNHTIVFQCLRHFTDLNKPCDMIQDTLQWFPLWHAPGKKLVLPMARNPSRSEMSIKVLMFAWYQMWHNEVQWAYGWRRWPVDESFHRPVRRCSSSQGQSSIGAILDLTLRHKKSTASGRWGWIDYRNYGRLYKCTFHRKPCSFTYFCEHSSLLMWKYTYTTHGFPKCE